MVIADSGLNINAVTTVQPSNHEVHFLAVHVDACQEEHGRPVSDVCVMRRSKIHTKTHQIHLTGLRNVLSLCSNSYFSSMFFQFFNVTELTQELYIGRVCAEHVYTVYMHRIRMCTHTMWTHTHTVFKKNKNTVHIWNACRSRVEVPIMSHYRQFEVIMSTPWCKWVSLCEMLWHLTDLSNCQK